MLDMLKYFLTFLGGMLFGGVATFALLVCAYLKYKGSKTAKPKRRYNCKKDHRDIRDYHFMALKPRAGVVPASVDLRSKMSPVVDQGNLGSCTANAIASGLREYLIIAGGGVLVRLSRLFLYYKEREIEGTIGEDSGAEIRDGMKVLQQTGVCPESIWPYIIKKFTKAPSKEATAAAGQYKINAYHRVNNLDELKIALADGQPVVIGFEVYDSFESEDVAKTGIVPMPADDQALLGGHAVCAVGYSEKPLDGMNEGYVIVRNSWGSSWADGGYCYMPYSVFNKLVMDMWTASN